MVDNGCSISGSPQLHILQSLLIGLGHAHYPVAIGVLGVTVEGKLVRDLWRKGDDIFCAGTLPATRIKVTTCHNTAALGFPFMYIIDYHIYNAYKPVSCTHIFSYLSSKSKRREELVPVCDR